MPVTVHQYYVGVNYVGIVEIEDNAMASDKGEYGVNYVATAIDITSTLSHHL